jgi:hypothetical protein
MPRHQMTMTTVTDSRMSVISTGSETSQTQTDGSKSGLSPLETLAKKMKYIDIEFSDEDGQNILPGGQESYADVFSFLQKPIASEVSTTKRARRELPVRKKKPARKKLSVSGNMGPTPAKGPRA